MDRPVYFVKYWDKGSTAIGADQMAPALERLGVPARAIYARELEGIRDAVLVFVKRADLRHLLAAGVRGNRRVLDVQDSLAFRRWLSYGALYDGILFRSRRALEDHGCGRAVCRTIYQHWDPRYAAHRNGAGGPRVGYVGIPRSCDLWGRVRGVEFVGPDEWFAAATHLDAHLSVRSAHREWLYKPNAKVATAAACDAVLVTTPDCASVELLGEDYPFYLAGSDLASVEAGVDRARAAWGGPEWREALARLRAVKEELAIERVAARYLELFRALD